MVNRGKRLVTLLMGDTKIAAVVDRSQWSNLVIRGKCDVTVMREDEEIATVVNKDKRRLLSHR